MSNALKFSRKQGEVVIKVEKYQPTEEELWGIGAGGAGNGAHGGHGGAHVASHGATPSGSPHGDNDAFANHSSAYGSATPHSRSPSSTSPSSASCSSSTDTYLKFYIIDGGCGIPRSKQHRLFQAFSQVDASDSRKHGGTGSATPTRECCAAATVSCGS